MAEEETEFSGVHFIHTNRQTALPELQFVESCVLLKRHVEQTPVHYCLHHKYKYHRFPEREEKKIT